jgi:hypothetical protein
LIGYSDPDPEIHLRIADSSQQRAPGARIGAAGSCTAFGMKGSRVWDWRLREAAICGL